MITLTNSSSKYLIPLLPLMERSLVASIYGNNPYSMECAYFQRKQVSEFYPNIKNIKTDRGLNCSNNLIAIASNIIRNYMFLIKVYVNRRFKRKNINEQVDKFFVDGFNSQEYKDAISICKKIGILDKEIEIKKISSIIADRLMTVGMVFGE
jgi:hypothetical protein